MKPSTVFSIFSTAIVSSRALAVPDSSDDAQDISIADGATPPPGEKIPGDNSFSLCKGDRSNDAVKITHVDLVPNPPIRGQDLVVYATATVNQPIVKGAVVDVKVKFLGSAVYSKRFDICEELGKVGQNCPVAPADISINETWPIPKKGFPHGNYGINAFARFPNGSPITCVEGKLKM